MRRVFAATAALAALSLTFPTVATSSAVGTAGTRPPRRVPAPPVHRSVPPTADTLPAGTAPPSPSPEEAVPAGPTPAEAIRACESNDDYRAENPVTSASGAYQFIDSTWRWVTGLEPPASAYPRHVQDAAFETLWADGAGASHWNPSRHCWAPLMEVSS